MYPKENVYVKYGDNSIKESKIAFTDPSLFNIFDIPLTSGDKENLLTAPNKIIMSESASIKYFGDKNPIGEIIELNQVDSYEVTGVFKDFPSNSHFHFDLIASLSSLEESRDINWLNNMRFFTYLLVLPQTDADALELKLQNMLTKYIGLQYDFSDENLADQEYSLQPVTDIHLHSAMYREIEPNSDIMYVYIFSAVAIFILLLAAVNFINLSTARSGNRAKEVGIRKTLGSYRSQLIKQFLAESITLSLFALTLAIIIVSQILPYFNNLVGRELSLGFFINYTYLFLMIGFVVLIGIFAGIYPAIILSSFNPAGVLSQKTNSGSRGKLLRHSLIVFQFVISITFIIGTMIVTEQLEYIQNKKIGFNKEHVLIIHGANILDKDVFTFKNQLLNNSNILSASISGFLPVNSEKSVDVMCPEGIYRKEGTPIQKWRVDFDYVKTMGMEILKGRNFSSEFQTDSMGVIINEAAVTHFGWDDPIGKSIYEGDGSGIQFKVIGVVKDFNFESLRNNIAPVGLYGYAANRKLISVRINSAEIGETVKYIEQIWNEFTGNQQFEFSFLEERFNQMYNAEQKLSSGLRIFSALALFVGCLGLLGLISFVVDQRKKEIGIRKVMGASVINVFYLFTKETLLLISIAFLLESPISYYFMNSWLQDFAYRININLTPFIISGFSAILISILTISYQVIKAARTNPINTINYE